MTIGHTLWPLAWASLLMVLLDSQRSSGLARFFQGAWIRSLGKYSYAMYVVQNPLKATLGISSIHGLSSLLGESPLLHMVYAGVMSGLTYALALLSWHVLEKHCLRLKDYFTVASPSATPTISATPDTPAASTLGDAAREFRVRAASQARRAFTASTLDRRHPFPRWAGPAQWIAISALATVPVTKSLTTT